MSSVRPSLGIADGRLLVYRLFDVADGIDLARAEAVLRGEGERLRLTGERPGFLALADPPLALALGTREVALPDGTSRSAASHVRLFAHGVASVRHEFALPPGADAAATAALVRALSDHPALERSARADARAICGRIGPAVDTPHETPVHETYTSVFVRALTPGLAPSAIAPSELAHVLLGEPPDVALSEQTISNATRHRFAYTEGDLCVLDWDSAFVVAPDGDRSVADVLELATAQLLEFRSYDAVFERELLAVTEGLRRRTRRFAWPYLGRTHRLARRLHRLVIESTEFVERVENAVTVVGDLFLARIHRAAVERFRIAQWQAGVLRRERAALEVAGLLKNEADTSLGHLLEGSIIALIVLEMAIALLRGH